MRPSLEQGTAWIFAAEQRSQCLLKGTSEQQPGSGFLLLPAVQVAITVAQRASKILGELGVAVCHEANSERRGGGAGEEIDSQALAGANASRLTTFRPLTTTWDSFTTPRRPKRPFSSTSSRPSNSGS